MLVSSFFEECTKPARGAPEALLLYGTIDLLVDPILLDDLRLDIGRSRRMIDSPENRAKIVNNDEVQRLPDLLNYVHQSFFESKRVFILTGSCARQSKQLGTNLLAGRALVYHLFPLTSYALGDAFDLQQALEVGLLPDCYLASSRELANEILRLYVLTYVEQEVQIEQWVRKIEPFRNFLSVAAQINGKIIDKSAIGRDVGVDDSTVADYYEILEDTLVGITLPAFHRSARRRVRHGHKFFFIDTGIKRALDRSLHSQLAPSTSVYGEAFEHFLLLEIIKISSYLRNDWRFSYYQTREGYEIDLVIERPGQPLLLVEIKSKTKISEHDCAVLNRLGPQIDKKAE